MANEAFLLDILENVDAYIYLKDTHGCYLFANRRVCELFKMPMSEIVGRGDERFFDAETIVQWCVNDYQVLIDGKTLRSEESHLNLKDGNIATYLSVKLPLHNELGEIYALCGIFTDISDRKKFENELRESKNRLQTIIQTSPECIQIVNEQGKLIQMNSAGLVMFEADSLEQVVNRSELDFVTPEYRPAVEKLHQRVIAGEEVRMEFEIIGFKGTRRWLATHAVPMLDNGNIVRLAITRDVTEQKDIEQKLRVSELKFRTLYNSTSDAVILYRNGCFIDCNKATLTLFGCASEQEFCLYNPADLSPPKQACGMDSLTLMNRYIDTAIKNGCVRFEWIHKRIDNGKTFFTEVLLNAVKFDGELIIQGNVRDISERKQMEGQIRQLAFYDSLTNLPNRQNLLDRLSHSIALSHREGKKLAVFMIDLDKFKPVNDKLGHAAGDDLLKQVAVRFTARLRDSDMVARLGGDEFVIMLENLIEPEKDAAKVALDVIADLTEPFELSSGHTVQIGASIGICFYPQHGITPEKLIDHADTALYQAKNNGRNCFAYYDKNATDY